MSITPEQAKLHPRNDKSQQFEAKVQGIPDIADFTAATYVPAAGDQVLFEDRIGRIDWVDGDKVTVRASDNLHYTVQAADLQKVEPDPIHGEQIEKTRVALADLYLQAAGVTSEQLEDLAWTDGKINVGAWGDIHEDAFRAYLHFGDEQIVDRFLDETAVEMGQYWEDHTRANGTESDVRGAYIAERTARALSLRHLIGEARGWTQEAYDHETRAWRENIGPIHPDDDVVAASWSRRPVPSAAEKRSFDVEWAAINKTITDAGGFAIGFDEDSGDVWNYVDEDKVDAATFAAYTATEARGNENLLFDEQRNE